MTPEQHSRHVEHDLRMASIHEAAHAVIARRYGLKSWAYVVPSNTNDPLEEKLFVGKAGFSEPSRRQMKMISLAGIVAEACDGDPDVDGLSLMDQIESGICFDISATDAAGAGKYTEEDLDHCIGLVREAWREIESEASKLAEQGMRLYREMQETQAA